MHYQGSCLCGGIQYRINGELSEFGYCHCRSCQKAGGSAFGANAGIERRLVEFEDPHQLLTEYQSSATKFRVFCRHCGSPMYAYLSTSPDLIRIRLGSLDTPLNKTCRAHTFVSEKASWEIIADNVPQFEQWADPNVLVQLGSKQKLT